MTDGQLETALRLCGGLVGTGLIVQLLSFTWNHPLTFIAFAVVGGGLVAGGVAAFGLAAYRTQMWRHRVSAPGAQRPMR